MNHSIHLIEKTYIEFKLQAEIAPRKAVMKGFEDEAATVCAHQEGHANEMNEAHKRIQLLQARLGVQCTQMGQMHKKIHVLELQLSMMCCTLCQIVEENNPSKWGALIKSLYMIHAKESWSTMKAEGFETEAQLLHQRKTLERYIIVLEKSITIRNGEFQQEVQHYNADHMRLLHECSQSNQNVHILAQQVKDLQGQVAYMKELAAKHKEATSESLSQLLQTAECTHSSSLSTRSQNTSSILGNRKPLCKKFHGENSSIICVKFDPDQQLLQQLRQKTLSTTPLSNIIKPYMHSSSTKRHVSMQHGSTQLVTKSEKLEDPELLNILERNVGEKKRREEEMEQIQSHIYHISAQSYLHPNTLLSSQTQNLNQSLHDQLTPQASQLI
ncbi:uncharacterized protein [Physcomitrium patens]|uniref:uncharacterized protein isoform X2 n=1 Tax=Physcomitrium patens TaxID=3218 RepID=UPI003CCDA8AE